MQNYTEISSATTLQNSLGPLLNNDKTLMSNNSGIAFPTTNLQLGMMCYRTDLLKLYECTDTGLQVWKLIFDLAKTATDKEYVDTGLATKQATITGAASTVVSANLTASRVAISGTGGKLEASAITTTKLGYLTDVTSNIQAQLNGKSATTHNHDTVYSLLSHTHASYVNQNAFSNIAVAGQTTQSADTVTDTLTLIPGTNMDSITLLNDAATFNASAQGVSAGSVGQAQLKSATSSQSLVVTSGGPGVDITLTGGSYTMGWFLGDNASQSDRYMYPVSHRSTYSAKVGVVFGFDKGDYTAYMYSRYVQASPPYNLGDGDIPLFIYALIENSTGKILGTSSAVDPHWAYNGGVLLTPDRICTKTGKKYKNVPEFVANKADLMAGIKSGSAVDRNAMLDSLHNKACVEVEIDHPYQNQAMNVAPHPWHDMDMTDKTAILLDPVSSVTLDLYELHKQFNYGQGEDSVTTLLEGEYLLFDNSPLVRTNPAGIISVAPRWKNTK